MERPIDCGFPKIGMGRIEKELLRFKEFMDEIKEEFFLVGGTCLGLVRDGKLIGYDKDIDIGVFEERSLYRIQRLEKEIFKYYDEVHIVGPDNGKILWLKKYFDGKYVLPIEVAAQYTKDGHLYYNRLMGATWEYEKGKCVWKRSLFDSFKKVNYLGVDFNVPSPVEEFLTAFYGPGWTEDKAHTDWRYYCHCLSEGWWK